MSKTQYPIPNVPPGSFMNKFECSRCGKCCKSESVNGRRGFYAFLFDFEVKRLRQSAEKLGIDLQVKPFFVLNDEISKQGIVVFYEFFSEDCPFYKDGCLIYAERPLMCRAFPVFQTKPFFASMACPAVKGLSQENPKEVFGVCFSACEGMDEVAFREQLSVRGLAKKGVVRLSRDDKFEALVDLSAFLKEKGL